MISLFSRRIEKEKLLTQNGESSHVLRIFDDEAQAKQSARNSSRMLEEAYETGVGILHKYADQRDRLKVMHIIHSRRSLGLKLNCGQKITERDQS
jgi:hypothetical protein